MIIFESILSTFKSSYILRGSWDSSVNWLEPQIEPPKANFIFSKSEKRSVASYNSNFKQSFFNV